MAKRRVDPRPYLFPTPTVLVSCADRNGQPNIITIAWAGVAASEPPTLGIGVRPTRHSHRLLREVGEFVVNIPSESLLWATDFCGTVSGRDRDKFQGAHLTPVPAAVVKPPLIAECPVNLECVVRQVIPLSSHDLFLGEVVAVHVEEECLGEVPSTTGQGQRWDVTKLKPLAYCHGDYWSLGTMLERFGFSRRREAPAPPPGGKVPHPARKVDV